MSTTLYADRAIIQSSLARLSTLTTYLQLFPALVYQNIYYLPAGVQHKQATYAVLCTLLLTHGTLCLCS